MAFYSCPYPILMVVYVEINVIGKKDAIFIGKDELVFLVVYVVYQQLLLIECVRNMLESITVKLIIIKTNFRIKKRDQASRVIQKYV